jgi:ComF family protein
LRCVARSVLGIRAREAVFSSTGFRIRAAQPAAAAIASVPRWAGRVAASVFFTFFPADCRVCGAPLIEISDIPVCKNCVGEPQALTGSLCAVCGEGCDFPSGIDAAQSRCRLCRKLHPPFDRAVAYGSYDGALRDLIHLLKFHRVKPLAKTLGGMLAEAIAGLEPSLPGGAMSAGATAAGAISSDAILVAPVPLFAGKKVQRGFNQAELIGRAALKRLARPERFEFAPAVLVRSRDTSSQIGLTRRQRRENLRGAFKAGDPTQIENRYILLIDDVYTTGSTASECARVLLRAGARRVWVATVARTLKVADLGLPEEFLEEAVVGGAASDEQYENVAGDGEVAGVVARG